LGRVAQHDGVVRRLHIRIAPFELIRSLDQHGCRIDLGRMCRSETSQRSGEDREREAAVEPSKHWLPPTHRPDPAHDGLRLYHADAPSALTAGFDIEYLV